MRVLALFLIAACSGRPTTPQPRPAAPAPDAAVSAPAEAPPIDASPGDAAIATTPAPSLPVVEQAPPALTAPSVTVKEGETVRLDGVAIALARSGHKHPARGGRARGFWTFQIGGTELTVSSDDTGFEAELAVGGRLYVLRHLDYRTFEVVRAARRVPAPLDEDTCAARIDDAARAAGLPEAGARSYSLRDGIVALDARVDTTDGRARGWQGRCGVYTRRVWVRSPIVYSERDDPLAP